jgi:hypothetical protein
MRLSEQQIADLGKLAVNRCEYSLASVTQLMEGPQAYAVVLSVACSLIEGAADMLQKGIEEHNGTQLSEKEAVYHVVRDLLDGLGIPWKHSSSPTRSAKK